MTGRSRRREHRGQFVREVKRWKLTELLVGIFLLLARRGAARLNFELRLNVGQKVKVYGTQRFLGLVFSATLLLSMLYRACLGKVVAFD
jgi:hypothetical protein